MVPALDPITVTADERLDVLDVTGLVRVFPSRGLKCDHRCKGSKHDDDSRERDSGVAATSARTCSSQSGPHELLCPLADGLLAAVEDVALRGAGFVR